MSKNRRRRIRIQGVIGLIISGISFLCVYYFLPKESSLYFRSDVTEFKDSMMPISIIVSLAIPLLFISNRIEYDGKIRTKIYSVIYIGLFGLFIHPLFSDTILTLGLKANRWSSNELITKNFKVMIKEGYLELDNTVWGIIPDKTYENEIDQLELSKEDYNLVKEHQEIILELKKGVFGIPFHPVLKK